MFHKGVQYIPEPAAYRYLHQRFVFQTGGLGLLKTTKFRRLGDLHQIGSKNAA